jgi:geranylgeranyl pyrophosphate synthase
MGPAPSETEKIARDWLAKNGKRWRPFLTACIWQAMADDPSEPIPLALKQLAVAAECFHKASLVHDDIEDNDDLRYDEPSLHSEFGVPVALNVGDLLLGDGYALIASTELSAAQRVAITRVAASGHRTLCLGQGDEFQWGNAPGPLSTTEVLEIFRKKTSPAFEVSLQFGALAANGDAQLCETISKFSEALGIAYQIRDDLEDMLTGETMSDLQAMRPSLPLAILHERVRGEAPLRQLVEKAWRKECTREELEQIESLFVEYNVADRCKVLQESYKEQAIRCLSELENPSVKGLLRRVISKIFTVEVKDWCSEFETRNAAGSKIST